MSRKQLTALSLAFAGLCALIGTTPDSSAPAAPEIQEALGMTPQEIEPECKKTYDTLSITGHASYTFNYNGLGQLTGVVKYAIADSECDKEITCEEVKFTLDGEGNRIYEDCPQDSDDCHYGIASCTPVYESLGGGLFRIKKLTYVFSIELERETYERITDGSCSPSDPPPTTAGNSQGGLIIQGWPPLVGNPCADYQAHACSLFLNTAQTIDQCLAFLSTMQVWSECECP